MIKCFAILVFTCAGFISQAQVSIITTIAGKSPYGFSGDGGPATNAQLSAPQDLCLDQVDNICIADGLNNRIRRISKADGTINTIAGTGTPGFFGDGGPATNAKFEVLQGIFLDGYDNIYVSDAINNRIRKIDAVTGIVNTIAGTGVVGDGGDGGFATSCQLNLPCGVFVDKQGNVFIADWGNNKVRKINIASGNISTCAGSGTSGFSGDGGDATHAALNGPFQICFDTSDNLLIADQHNHRVRKVDKNTGLISTIAGNGTAGFSGDNGPAVNAKLNQPTGVFVDKQNNTYVAEYGNGTIRKIDGITGIISSLAGTGVVGFSGDGAPATSAKLFCTDVFVDRYGNLIIADLENNRIRKVSTGVAVNGIDKEVESRLYPNPTKGMFTIQTPINISLVSIYNIAGMRVYERTCTTPETEVDITNQPPGVYMVYVQCGDKKYVSKVVRE